MGGGSRASKRNPISTHVKTRCFGRFCVAFSIHTAKVYGLPRAGCYRRHVPRRELQLICSLLRASSETNKSGPKPGQEGGEYLAEGGVSLEFNDGDASCLIARLRPNLDPTFQSRICTRTVMQLAGSPRTIADSPLLPLMEPLDADLFQRNHTCSKYWLLASLIHRLTFAPLLFSLLDLALKRVCAQDGEMANNNMSAKHSCEGSTKSVLTLSCSPCTGQSSGGTKRRKSEFQSQVMQ